MSPTLRSVLLLLFCQTGLGGPLAWIRVHHARDHWQNQPASPPYFAYGHSLLRDFVWNLHLAFAPVDEREWQARYGIEKAIDEDPLLRFLERTWRRQVAGAWLLACLLAGPGFATVVVCGRVAATILFHWLIGYLSHTHGEVAFDIPGACEVGRDSWTLGALSFGEGFHNSHHALPRSARMGLRRGDLDLGYWVVRALARLGWVTDVIGPGDMRAPRAGVVGPGPAPVPRAPAAWAREPVRAEAA
jgi:stearoyl-CoA desaturase (delta-9 desaturase)